LAEPAGRAVVLRIELLPARPSVPRFARLTPSRAGRVCSHVGGLWPPATPGGDLVCCHACSKRRLHGEKDSPVRPSDLCSLDAASMDANASC